MSNPQHEMNFRRDFLRRPHLMAISVIFLIYILSFCASFAFENGFNPPFPSGSDLCVHVPMALQLKDPSLYSPHDEFIKNYKAFFPTFYWRALALFPNIRIALLTGSVMLSLIFLLGVYGFIFSLTRSYSLAVFFSLLSIKSWPALNTLQWGGIWPEMVLPRTLVMVFSPLLFLGMYYFKAFWQSAILALIIGILFHAHPMASHLFVLWIVALFCREEKPPLLKFALKSSALFAFFLLGALPSLKGVLLLSFGKYLGHAAGVSQVSVVPERSLHFLQFDAATILAFLFNLVPLASVAVMGFLKSEGGPVRRMVAGQIVAIVVFSVGFLTVGQINPRWSFGEFPRMSIYLYPLCFFFAAKWLMALRIQRPKPFWILLMILAMHHGSTYAAISQVFFPGTAVASAFAKEPRAKWMSQEFLDLCAFAKEKTAKDSVYLVPPGEDVPKGFDLFRVYAVRSIVVHWKGIYSDRDWALFVRTRDAYRKRSASELLKIAQDYGAEYVVVPSVMEEVLLEADLGNKPLVYRNISYSLVKVK